MDVRAIMWVCDTVSHFMELPPKLYKYQAFNAHSLKNLKDQRIFFSAPCDFNDPFECILLPLQDQISDAEYAEMKKALLKKSPSAFSSPESSELTESERSELNSGIKRGIEDCVSTNRNKLGIACLSAKKNDLLMWSYYADGHRGFCLEFATDTIPFIGAKPVEYGRTLPRIDVVKFLSGQGTSGEAVKMLLSKHVDWKHEEEWRLIHEESRKSFGYETKALTGVYFGTEMDFSHKEIISLILRGQHSEVRFYESLKSHSSFSLDFREVCYTSFLERSVQK